MHVLAFLLQFQPTIVSATQNIATSALVRIWRLCDPCEFGLNCIETRPAWHEFRLPIGAPSGIEN
jgi:hypothetical protein